MSDAQTNALKTTSGSTQLDHRAITAGAKGRNQLVATWFGGTALVLLIILYGYTVVFQKDGRDLLTLIGTLFGILIGRYSHRDT